MTTGTNELTYQELLLAFPPRIIQTEEEYAKIQEAVDRLVDQQALTAAEQEYLDLLGALIWDYETRTEEKQHYELRGVELIKGLMELSDLTLKDLNPIFKTKSISSSVLNGKRRLTVEHIDRLAAFFNIPHSYFFEPVDVAPLHRTTQANQVENN
jgi:HTH-type transcriptional regulator/antitoxin HigA